MRALAEICAAHDRHGVKLNWRMMARRQAGQGGDFCWYADDVLVGYAPLDRFGAGGEATTLVHPDLRRRGIGRALVTAAHEAARRQGVTELFLVNVRASATGHGFLAALGRALTFSEYHLEWAQVGPPAVPTGPIAFRRAERSDLDFLTRIAAISFDRPDDEARQMGEDDLAGSEASAYLALRDGQPIGRLSALHEDGGIYLRSFGVLPEERGHGVGRALLAATIAHYWQEGERQFSLDVVADNSNALSLYLSVGFHEAFAYDYYDWPLR